MVFYYQTTINYSDEIDYHMFVVSSVLFCIPFIFSGVSLLCETEKKITNKDELFYFHILALIYLIFVISFTSCLSLEFVLTNRTSNDVSIWLPLYFRFKLPIETYASMLVAFPFSNLILSKYIDIIRLIIRIIYYRTKERK